MSSPAAGEVTAAGRVLASRSGQAGDTNNKYPGPPSLSNSAAEAWRPARRHAPTCMGPPINHRTPAALRHPRAVGPDCTRRLLLSDTCAPLALTYAKPQAHCAAPTLGAPPTHHPMPAAARRPLRGACLQPAPRSKPMDHPTPPALQQLTGARPPAHCAAHPGCYNAAHSRRVTHRPAAEGPLSPFDNCVPPALITGPLQRLPWPPPHSRPSPHCAPPPHTHSQSDAARPANTQPDMRTAKRHMPCGTYES